MLPAAHRLRRTEDFSAVFRTGRRASSGPLVVHLLASDAHPSGSTDGFDRPSRAGFVVSRKVGNSVVRHRVTRRLRPLVAHRLTSLPPGTDVVVRALPAAAGADSVTLATALDAALHSAARKAGVGIGVES